MSFPSVLGPWYVIQQINWGRINQHDEVKLEYFTASDEGEASLFQEDPKKAILFTSLHSAARVAASEGAQVRVLTSKEEADEFGRS